MATLTLAVIVVASALYQLLSSSTALTAPVARSGQGRLSRVVSADSVNRVMMVP